MARRRRHRSARGNGAPGWLWMLFGLSLGLAVAFGVYLHGRNPVRASPAAAAEPASTAPAQRPAGGNAAQAAREAEAARFDFYEILPQFEVVVPEIETAQRRAPAASAAPASAAQPSVSEPGSYVLQAGSFTSIEDADRRQASLALLGVEARIQRVTIDDAVFHRVRIGPISDLAELDRIRTRLREANVDTLVMRMQ